MLSPCPLGGAGNTACEDMGYPFTTVMGVKNTPPKKASGRRRLMEDLTLRLIIINQLLLLGAGEASQSFFPPNFSLCFPLFFFLHCFGSGVFERRGKSESLDVLPRCTLFLSRRHQWDQTGSFPFLRSSQNILASLRRAMLMNEINAWSSWAKLTVPYMQLVWGKPELVSVWSTDRDALSPLVHRSLQIGSWHLAVVVGSGMHRGPWSLPNGNVSDTDLNIKQREDGGCHLVEKGRVWHSSSTLLLC